MQMQALDEVALEPARAQPAKPQRALQVWRWMYKPGNLVRSFDDMEDVSAACRDKLSRIATLDSGLELADTRTDAGGTTKLTFRVKEGLPGAGSIVETVVIHM